MVRAALLPRVAAGLALNWNPMLCDWKGPNLNDIACTRCLGGWVGPGLTLAPDADVTELPFCSQPPFGTINYSNRTLHASIPTVLELGNTVWSAAGPSIDDFVVRAPKKNYKKNSDMIFTQKKVHVVISGKQPHGACAP